MATNEQVLRSIPEIGLDFPSGRLVEAAFAYAQKYCPEEVNNHAARCAYWALLLAKKLPSSALATSPAAAARRPVHVEDVVLICLLHDLGLATWLVEEEEEGGHSQGPNPLPGLLSLDKRFEVDGANIARAFVAAETEAHNDDDDKKEKGDNWDDARLNRLWTAIALHASPSFAWHAPAPEIVLAHFAITVDFFGPYWFPTCTQPPAEQEHEEKRPHRQGEAGAYITVDEYRAVTARFPREAFGRGGMQAKLCALCRRKPETTYDNFAGLFGRAFGLDGRGGGRDAYARQWEGRQDPGFLVRPLARLEEGLEGLGRGTEEKEEEER